MATNPASLSSIFSDPSKLALIGLSSGAGAFGTPGNSSSSTNTSSSPVISESVQELLNQLGDQYKHLTQTGQNLQPYEQGGIQQINSNADLLRKASQEALASRGLSTSPVAASVEAGQNQNRVSQINQFQQTIPLLQRQLQLGNLGAESGFAASVPHGVTSSGNTNTVTTQGGGPGGFLGGFGKALGAFLGLGAKV